MSHPDKQLVQSVLDRFGCTQVLLSRATGIPLNTLRAIMADQRNFDNSRDRRLFLKILSGKTELYIASTKGMSVLEQMSKILQK